MVRDSDTDDSEVIYRDALGRVLRRRDLSVSRHKPPARPPVPDDAETHYERGRQAGSRGYYALAVEEFVSAMTLAPEWSAPVYDLAFTYLLMDDPSRAEELYARVDALEPGGFFTTKMFLDSLRRERNGEIPEGFSKAYAMTEHMEPAERRAVLLGIVDKFPNYPAAWKDLANLLTDDEGRLQALDRGLEYQPDADTRGLLLVNRALYLARHDGLARAVQILAEL